MMATTSQMAIAALISVCIAGESPLKDISFDAANWTFDVGVNVSHGPNGTMACIKGDPSKYIRASLTLSASDLPATGGVFFVVDTFLHGIIPGSEEFDAPKIKVSGVEHQNDRLSENFRMLLDGVWVPAALLLHRSDFAQDDHLLFEISIQSAAGQFCARSVQLQLTVPPPSYTYPFPAPNNSAVSLVIDLADQTLFRSSLLSTNVAAGYGAPQIQDLLRWLKLPQLRFPGGTVGNFYNWRTDGFYPNNTCKNNAADKPGFLFHYDEFVASMDATNASVVLLFNVIEDSVADSVSRLQDRFSSGLRIDWIELGNENYGTRQVRSHAAIHYHTLPHARTLLDFLAMYFIFSPITTLDLPLLPSPCPELRSHQPAQQYLHAKGQVSGVQVKPVQTVL
jgi:hypothetical protein